MRVGVVGHVEWADLVRVGRFPTRGDVVQAVAATELAAGSGAIAAVQLAKLAGEATFFTRLTDDERGYRARNDLERQGVRVEAVHADAGLRRAIVLVDETSERTITISGEKRVPLGSDPLPWGELSQLDAVCFLCGDTAALTASRTARVLVATARWLPSLRAAGVRIDALVGSAVDPVERYTPGVLTPEPSLVVTTEGADGGSFVIAGRASERFAPVTPPGPALDAYGCGDSFVAAVAFALAEGREPVDAVSFAARCGAACLAGPGLSGQLRLAGVAG